MELLTVVKVLLLSLTAISLIYSYWSSLGTDCLNKFAMNLALFLLFYSIFLLVVEKKR